MPTKTALCPSCGAPVEFHSGVSVLLVCPFCRSTLLRSAEKIENIGRMAELIEDFSPLQLGSEGRYRGQHFGIIGRIQLKYGAGLWNEWHLLFDDARNGWLSDANGDYTVTFVKQTTEKFGPFASLQPGDLVPIDGKAFSVTNIEEAICIAGDGELPFKVGAGYPAPVVDARCDEAFATLDYSEDPPLVYIGESVSRESLQLANLRQNIPGGGPIEKGVRAFDCLACGAPLEVVSKAIARIACPSCGSLLDVEDARFKLVKKSQEGMRIDPPLPIGSKGKLRGIDYEVIGFLRRETEVEGIDYRWDEYLLFDPRGEFRWLSCSEGHWNFITVLSKPPSGGNIAGISNLTYEKGRFKHFQTCQAEVVHVLGAFNWRVSVGERASVSDYVAPPRMLSCEKTDKEIVWSLGEYLPPEEIATAFKLKSPLTRPLGIYANQPNPSAESNRRNWGLFWKLAVAGLIVHLLLMLFNIGGKLAEEVFVYGGNGGNGEKTHVSKPFELKSRSTTLRVENSSTLDNGWLNLDMVLVNETTGESWQAQREISYYSGIDGGESWSEGSHDDEVVFANIPAGTYHLTMEGEAAPELSGMVPARTRVRRGGALWSNFFLLAGLLLVFPIWSFIRMNAFEKKRWMESDHPPAES